MSNSLQKKVLDALKASPNTWRNKIIQASERGCPDILACVRGRFWGIEIKSGSDKLKPHQHEQLCRIIEAGGVGMVVASDIYHAGRLNREIRKLSDERCGDAVPLAWTYEGFLEVLHGG